MSSKDPRLRGRAGVVSSSSPTQYSPPLPSPSMSSTASGSSSTMMQSGTSINHDSKRGGNPYSYTHINNHHPRDEQRGRDRDRGRERPALESNPSYGSETSITDRTAPYSREPPADLRNDHQRTYSSRLSPRRQHDREPERTGPLQRGRSPPSRGQRHDARHERGRIPIATSSNAVNPTLHRSNSNLGGTNIGGARPTERGVVSSATSASTRYRNPFERPLPSMPTTIVPSTIEHPPPMTTTTPRMNGTENDAISSMRPSESEYSRGRSQINGERPDQDIPSRRRSKSRARSKAGERSRSRSRSKERERGRSKSRAYSRERGRSKSRARSRDRDRGSSKSRARSKSRLRSRSRPVRQVVTMGEFSKRARSQSRPRSRYEDSDEFTSSEYSETDSSYHGHRSRGSRPRKRARYARYSHSDSEASDLKSGTESEESGIDSDAPLAFHKVRPSSCATATSDPAARLSGPMKKLQTEMEQLTDKFATRMHKLELTYRKIRTLNKRINSEMRELSKEIQQKAPGEPGDKTMLSSSSRSTYPGYISAPSSPVSGSTQRVLEPIPPPPSLTPVSSTGRTNQSSGRARVSEPSVMERVAQRAFPDPRARGYMRVFEQSQYQLPIANQSTMSVLSIRNKMVHEKAFTGRASRPMVLNPFSQQTQFEGIAAAGSFDGFIYFWDINTQKVLLSVPPTEHHVIPFPETLTWVAPDTIVAVSHLKDGIPWPEAVSEMNGNPSSTSLPDTQTNLLTIYFRGDGTLGFKIVTITSMPHTKPINTVTGAMKENGSMSYITGGADKRLYHWRFLPPRDDDSNGTYSPEKLEELHQTHTSAINCTFYSHHSKILYSCGMDSRYVSYDLDAQKIIRNQEPDLGKLLYITQNPVDPRINTLTSLTSRQQYSLMDERTPGKPVLTFGYDNGSTKISKLSVPSWHPDGGLFCTGTSTNGEVMLWDVRWNGIRMENHRRPGTGMVTGNVQFDPAGGPTVPHPIFNGPRARRAEKPQPGGPSQRLDVGGTRCISLLFHPTRNMMIGQSADSSLTFMDYDLRSDPIVVKV